MKSLKRRSTATAKEEFYKKSRLSRIQNQQTEESTEALARRSEYSVSKMFKDPQARQIINSAQGDAYLRDLPENFLTVEYALSTVRAWKDYIEESKKTNYGAAGFSDSISSIAIKAENVAKASVSAVIVGCMKTLKSMDITDLPPKALAVHRYMQYTLLRQLWTLPEVFEAYDANPCLKDDDSVIQCCHDAYSNKALPNFPGGLGPVSTSLKVQVESTMTKFLSRSSHKEWETGVIEAIRSGSDLPEGDMNGPIENDYDVLWRILKEAKVVQSLSDIKVGPEAGLRKALDMLSETRLPRLKAAATEMRKVLTHYAESVSQPVINKTIGKSVLKGSDLEAVLRKGWNGEKKKAEGRLATVFNAAETSIKAKVDLPPAFDLLKKMVNSQEAGNKDPDLSNAIRVAVEKFSILSHCHKFIMESGREANLRRVVLVDVPKFQAPSKTYAKNVLEVVFRSIHQQRMDGLKVHTIGSNDHKQILRAIAPHAFMAPVLFQQVSLYGKKDVSAKKKSDTSANRGPKLNLENQNADFV